MDDSAWKTLIDAAKQATSQSYSPYSGLSVGAAVRTSSGETYVGANVESASFGLSICAERVAVFKAVTENPNADADSLIEAVVAVDAEGDVLSPCGACRQVILEFGQEAEVRLPSGARSIGDTLAEPFEKTALAANPRTNARAADRAVGLGKYVTSILARSEEDRILLMRLMASMQRDAAGLYQTTSFEQTRSVMFARVGEYLVIPPGFFCNFENPEERTIRILVGHGITGGAYASKHPNFGVPCSNGVLPSDPLPHPEQDKVDDRLKWVVAWPLGTIGAVSVDGFDEIGLDQMRGISESGDLKRTVDRIGAVLKR